MVLPYASHESSWDNHNKTRLSFLLRHAADQVTLTAKGGGKDYQQTYIYMVEQCKRLVAICDEKAQDDAGQAVGYAREKGCAVTLIHPENGKMTENK